MKKYITRKQKINREISRAEHKKYLLEKEKEQKQQELNSYCHRHRLNFNGLSTNDTQKLNSIYDFMDKNFPVDWEGGLRCDNRGMKLCFWLDDDPDFLIIHLTSTSQNICFSGSTSWMVQAPTLEEKIEKLHTIKAEISKIINQK